MPAELPSSQHFCKKSTSLIKSNPCRYPPQPVCNASVIRRRDGKGTCRGTPGAHLSSYSHRLTHSQRSPDKRASVAGSSIKAVLCDFNYYWREHILALPVGTNHFREAMQPTICCHISAGRDISGRNLSTISLNLVI